MKILHILDHSIPLHSGYTFRTRSILEGQRELGYSTAHITSPKHNLATKNEIKEEIVEEFHFYRTLPVNTFLSKLPIFNQLSIVTALEKRLELIISDIKPDVLHAHSPALNGLAAARVGKRHKIPVVYEIRAFWEDAAVDHGTTTEGSLRYRLTKALETYVIKQVDAVTTICEGLRKDIISRGISADKITVIPNAVDPEKFIILENTDTVLKNELGLADKKVLGFIGSFYAYEGLSLLIQSLPDILLKDKDVRVLLVGGGPQNEPLKQLVQSLNLNEHVIFTGRVPHDTVQSYYNVIDILVYPRLSMRLTELVTPLKPLEAMAQGRLIIASDVGGHKELISDGKTALLFKSDNKSDLTNKVINLLNNPALWDMLRKNSREYVESERSWSASVSRYQAVYGGLVEK